VIRPIWSTVLLTSWSILLTHENLMHRDRSSLLRVQRCFLCHQFGYQLFGPVDGDLIRYSSLYSAIPLNVFVDLYALLAHGQFRIRAWGRPMASTFIRRRNG
jgi:hypothetical protein